MTKAKTSKRNWKALSPETQERLRDYIRRNGDTVGSDELANDLMLPRTTVMAVKANLYR